MHTYLAAMAFRTASFPLAVWALLSGWVVVGVILAMAATFLPQISVTIANAIDHRTDGGGQPVSPTRALRPPPTTPPPTTPPPTANGSTHPGEGPDADL